MSNRRIREKKAVKAALKIKNYFPSDKHAPETRIEKKIRLAIKRQCDSGKRQTIIMGDQWDR